MTTPTRFTAEDYERKAREVVWAETSDMLRQAAEQARTLERVRAWIAEQSDGVSRLYKNKVQAMLDGETAR